MTGPGVGVDLVEVGRIGRLVRDPAFLKRVFTAEEIAYCRGKKNAAQHFAVRFAAKEAILKALGHKGVALKDIGVRNLSTGQPVPVLHGRLKPLGGKIRLSLAHTKEYAVAMAVLGR